MLFLKVFSESIRQALAQLSGNKLRTFLSLLGISIGIFCIIGVLSAVQSLQDNVTGSLNKLGDDTVYVDKFPWKDEGKDWRYYWQRPFPDYDDYEALKDNLEVSQLVGYWSVIGFKPIKYRSRSVEGGVLVAITNEVPQLLDIQLQKGRFFTQNEYRSGSDKLIIGDKLAEELFGALEPVGKTIRMQGRKYEVIGVTEPAGSELINVMNFEDALIVGYYNAARFVNLRNRENFGGSVAAKATPGIANQQLIDEMRGVIRAERRLRPREDDTFALNELDVIATQLDSIFGVLNVIGFIIGGFSILVGGISVANIMFVSVKERTGLIGVKKALGAKQFVILLEFLTESVILCIIGGVMGLILVVVVTTLLSNAIDFDIRLNATYAVIGVLLSALIGVLAGAVPAGLAARMDPVEAMRS